MYLWESLMAQFVTCSVLIPLPSQRIVIICVKDGVGHLAECSWSIMGIKEMLMTQLTGVSTSGTFLAHVCHGIVRQSSCGQLYVLGQVTKAPSKEHWGQNWLGVASVNGSICIALRREMGGSLKYPGGLAS